MAKSATATNASTAPAIRFGNERDSVMMVARACAPTHLPTRDRATSDPAAHTKRQGSSR